MLRWKGLMADADKRMRRVSVALLTLLCITMVATQMSYVVVAGAHLMFVLAAISSASLLFGVATGTAIAAIAGLAEMIHAQVIPFDVYERYFQNPLNSVILLAFVGFFLGLMYALVDRYRGEKGWRRPTSLILCNLLASILFSCVFQASTYAINSVLALSLPSVVISQLMGSREFYTQFIADFVLMAVFCLVTDYMDARRKAHASETTLRQTFRWWLIMLTGIGYLIVVGLSYTYITISCRNTADDTIQSGIDYLQAQLSERDNLINAVARRTRLSNGAIDDIHTSAVAGVAKNITIGSDCIVAIADNGIILSSNVDEWVGKGFLQVVGKGFTYGFDEALFDDDKSTDWYSADGSMNCFRVAEKGYVRVAQTGIYDIMLALPHSEVFYYRTVTMVLLSAAFLFVLAGMYMVASVLLREVVVKGFESANEVLSRITEGELDEVVDVKNSVEFTNLSRGINSTVGNLRESIKKTQEAVDRENRTARAIQNNALPGTFPPFPEIDAFDIYASVNTAEVVGGGFYDFFLVNPHSVGFLIGDVSQRGISAALFMMAVKNEINSLMVSNMGLLEAMHTANAHLCADTEDDEFACVWAAVLDYDTGELTYVNAGGQAPYLRHRGAWSRVEGECDDALGKNRDAEYHSATISLARGDEILLYGEGVDKACNTESDQYGEKRLGAFLDSHLASHPYGLVKTLKKDVRAWVDGVAQTNDIAVLALEYGSAPEATGTITVRAEEDNLDRALGFIHAELGRRMCPISVQNLIDVAFEEFFINVCKYAYADAEELGDVSISYVYHTNPSAFTVTLTDTGVPFDPTEYDATNGTSGFQTSAPGGLGIATARKSVDELVYTRENDENIVSFTKSW